MRNICKSCERGVLNSFAREETLAPLKEIDGIRKLFAPKKFLHEVISEIICKVELSAFFPS